jgi:hypothetical protein
VSNVYVKLIRCLLYGLAVIAAVLLSLALFLQAQARVLRHRADRLLTDFQSVELQQTTFQQTAQLRQKWSRWISYANGRPCTTVTCDFSVVLEDFSVRHSTTFERPWLVRAYMALGGRPARIVVRAYSENGIVSTEDIAVETVAPAASDRTYDILASAHGSAHYSDVLAPGPKHYKVHQAANCWTCIFVNFAPDVEQSDRKRLLSFDLSCLAAFAICRNADDLMPNAWSEVVAEENNWCAADLRSEIQRAWNIGIFEVISDRTEGMGQLATVKLLEKLRGATTFQVNGKYHVFLSSPVLANRVAAGKKLIILFLDLSPEYDAHITPMRCGTLDVDKDTLEQVRKSS